MKGTSRAGGVNVWGRPHRPGMSALYVGLPKEVMQKVVPTVGTNGSDVRGGTSFVRGVNLLHATFRRLFYNALRGLFYCLL